MGQVLCTAVLEKGVSVRVTAKFEVQVADRVRQWNTNTGRNDGPPFLQWRKPESSEAYKIKKLLGLHRVERTEP